MKLDILCNASLSLMHLGDFLTTKQKNFWRIIDDAGFYAKKDDVTTSVALTVAEIRAMCEGKYDFHIHSLEDKGEHVGLFELIFCDLDRMTEDEPPVFTVLMKLEGADLVYMGETCVLEANPYDFCGRALSVEEECLIDKITFDAV